MALHDTPSYTIVTSDATPSLPDPTTVSGRSHMLVNNDGFTPVTWTSTGATPFVVNGVNAVNVVVPRGAAQLVYSNGTRWVCVLSGSGSKRIVAATAVSDASGNATFTFSPAFAAVPVVAAALQTTNTNATEIRVTALSASSCTVNVRQSPGVVILGISVLQVPQPLAGATVHLHAMDAG